MRDRLIELVNKILKDNLEHVPLNVAINVADFLLANGVVVVDTNAVSIENRPLISTIAQYPIDEVVSLMKAKEEGQVIVPPCKVGDVVYFYKAEVDEICPAKVIKICNNFYTPSMPLWITIECDSKLIGKQTCEMNIDVFKLLCHHTKEEAEKALKGAQR